MLGSPTRRALPGEIEALNGVAMSFYLRPGATGTFHPVFRFAHHFHSKDDYERGYTANSSRGDHMSIPGYTEDGSWGIIEISFHKGETWVEFVTYEDVPEGPSPMAKWHALNAAALALLDSNETR